MPLTVITMRNAIPSLRGDLSRWMQEISTGVYVGNFNSKVREELWERVKQNIGRGEATLSYACRNEIGYNFETHSTERKLIDMEGIPLVFFPKEDNKEDITTDRLNYSNAARFHKVRKFKKVSFNETERNYVVIDIETDGLNFRNNNIIEIGAVKAEGEKLYYFHRLINTKSKIPDNIIALTGITNELLNNDGVEISVALDELLAFIGKCSLIGYNIEFDISFLNKHLKKINKLPLDNYYIDLKNIIKKEKPFLESYSLQNVLKIYGFDEIVPHRALEDAKLINNFITKVNGFLKYLK
ncbi:type I-E CRISPR-associated endoribonuclease Cas2 [Tuanshanicoccus lijuaniae]|uniref:type I-E CRISPR-associated endoribonuclease Cas2e n=1 Tax=Aerococcaceae bacterium zg-1292 TaxID=2774330 RepID=UPI0019379215|nr:type I-E CRISPR-associated endoribonuclease Cas2 [Aerococcaceae bacterium zg-1292]QQA37699.1 type I-E CRISPR-associated endoribonuclease Cas2 [Aerococcaceae bacterium zg-1292]